MPGLNILVLTPDAERFRGVLTLALAHAALGGEARLFLQLDAVRLIAPPVEAREDRNHVAHGLPTLAKLIEEALDAGITVIACQSGLALAAMDAARLDPRVEAGGPISFLQQMKGSDRLIAV
ncbi:MAG TPA: DsrE family protein [Sphingobium sp.]|nr:DsrE family protein [Sphingobium sp.]